MAILRDFERRLEGLVEGLFAGAFGGGLQPVELAKRVLREMDAGKTVGVNEIWAPNHFAFDLSRSDFDRLEQAEGALASELQRVVRDHAVERGWGLLGPPEMEFRVDERLGKGRFRCQASIVEGADRMDPIPTPVALGAAAPSVAAAERSPERVVDASLLVQEHGAPERMVRLSKEVVTIGRLPDCDIVLSDPGASRRHAEIRREDGAYVLRDLGSTNGTIVNGEATPSHALRGGDRITIGATELEFRTT